MANQGVTTIIYPVRDAARAKTLYRRLLGIDPYVDEAYYVGYRIGNQEVGLDPNGHSQGMTGAVGYFQVADIRNELQLLLDAGGQVQQDVKDVGGGKLTAIALDADGNVVGLMQDP